MKLFSLALSVTGISLLMVIYYYAKRKDKSRISRFLDKPLTMGFVQGATICGYICFLMIFQSFVWAAIITLLGLAWILFDYVITLRDLISDHRHQND